MRTLTTIFVIIVLLIGGSYISYRYIETTTQTTGTHLEVVEQSIFAQKWEEAENELTIVQQSWDKYNTWWSILLDHQEIDTIGLSMKRLEGFIERQDVTLSLGEVSSLKLFFEYIYDKEKFTIKNIL